MYSLVQHMAEIGYQPSNNIHNQPGLLMCPARGNVPCPPQFHEVQVLTDRIRIFTTKFCGEPYTKASYWDTVTVAVFARVEDFLTWCAEHGRLSEPGQ